MKRIPKRQKWLAAGVLALAAVLLLCAWMFGWGQGSIQVMDFSADAVERIELSCTMPNSHRTVVQDKEDIQALIDSVNAFQHTGNDLKYLFRSGLFSGGTVLYEFHVFLTNGEELLLSFGDNSGGQDLSDVEVSYWISGTEHLFGNTCRGSLEVFWSLYEN